METILEMHGIKKCFGQVQALSNVDMIVKKGEIHAICGENGAGKSTLMKVLSGVYPYGTFDGQILYQGEEQKFSSIHESEKKGIIIIHQELALVPMLSITENIFLGNEQSKAGIIDWNSSYKKTKEVLTKVGLTDSPDSLISDLGIGKQQLVEIAKALSKEVKLLILDEPTASLNDNDSDRLLTLLLELKARGVTSIIISHKLNEISRIADSITIIRDGASVDYLNCREDEVSEDRIIKAMVGRDMEDRYPKRTPNIGEVLFEVKDWCVNHSNFASREVIKGINIKARKGEIVGIAGLMGSGRTELAMSIFGKSYGTNIRGSVSIHDKVVDVSTVRKAIDNGIAYVTEDRKGYGLLLEESIKKNTSLANLAGISKHLVVNEYQEAKIAKEYRNKLRIRCSDVEQHTENLSGGNQQKVVISKWLFTSPDVLILDEPTRGVDVGAKYEIYTIIDQVAQEGKCIVMISSEMPELLGMCDRIYVMNEGKIVGEFLAKDANQEVIMRSIMRNGAN